MSLFATRLWGVGAAALVVALFVSGPGAGRASAKTLATIDGQPITDEDVAVAEEDLGPTLPAQLDGAQKDAYVLDYLIDMKLVAKKADQDHVGVGPDMVRRMNYFKDKLMMEAMLGETAKGASSEAAMQTVYDEAAKAQKPEAEIHARHILVPTEAEAMAAIKRIKGGEDFGAVAKDVSKDAGAEGGDLGWFSRERMVPEFAEAAFKLELHQLSAPVQTQFGWHVIEVEEKREKPFPAFAEVKDQVARYVAQKAQSDLIMTLRDGAKIERAAPEAGTLGAPAAAPAK